MMFKSFSSPKRESKKHLKARLDEEMDEDTLNRAILCLNRFLASDESIGFGTVLHSVQLIEERYNKNPVQIAATLQAIGDSGNFYMSDNGHIELK